MPRRDFQAAIADYTQAIALDPANTAFYRARAQARLAAGQPVLAMADLDEALKRQPDDTETLMRRGQLYLGSRDTVRAKADFEAAMKLAPSNSDLIAQRRTATSAPALPGRHPPARRLVAPTQGYDLPGHAAPLRASGWASN